MRIAIGHGILRMGLFIRKASMTLAALCTVAILVVLISALFGTDDYPTIFGQAGERVSAWTYIWQAAILNVALIVVGRFALASIFAVIGWRILPEDHRHFLEDLDDRMLTSMRDAR